MSTDIIKENLIEIVDKFRNAKVLVIGDLILDEFVWGSVSRISPEAPVPVVLVDKESYRLGGACNVAGNICALGGKVFLTGIIGKDTRGRILKKILKEKSIDLTGLIEDNTRPTTLKSRVIAHHQQVVRIDREKVDSITGKIRRKIIKFTKEILPEVDIVIIEDYGKGVVVPELIEETGRLCEEREKMTLLDPKKNHFSYYKNITVITPNRQEAEQILGWSLKKKEDFKKAGQIFNKRLKCKAVLITLGEDGMCLIEKNDITFIPTVAQEVFDVSGAGDTVASIFALSLAAGASSLEAAFISNYAAGVVVGKLGTEVVYPEELIGRINEATTYGTK